MKIKNLLFLSLLLVLMAGHAIAQEPEPQFPNQNFESDRGDWNFISENQSSGAISSITNTTVGGSNSFRVSTPNVVSYLVSPILEGSTGVSVTFEYTNYYVGATSFRVGYTEEESFNPELVEWGEIVVADQGTMYVGCSECQSGWTPWSYELPVGAKHFVIAMPDDLNNLFFDDFVFTVVTCGRPTVPKIEAGKTSLTLNWTGDSDNYKLRYRKCYSATFDNDLDGWSTFIVSEEEEDLTSKDSEEEDLSWIVMDGCAYSPSLDGSSNPVQFYTDDYLVSPRVELGDSLTFWAKGASIDGYEEETFGVAVSTGGNSADDFVLLNQEWTANAVWTKYSVDLSGYEGMRYVAIVHLRSAGEYADPDNLSGILVDNITIFTSNVWTPAVGPITASPYTLTGLDHETTYALQMRSDCGENEYSSWTDMVVASTTDDADNYIFIHAGDWYDEGNWEGGVAPVEGVAYDDVTILANVTIPDNCVAVADSINVKFGRTITIQDGGQLKHNNEGVVVTLQKGIARYNVPQGTTDGWYLLSFPVKVWDAEGELYLAIEPDQVDNLLEDTYDLYKFNPWNGGGEWINYKGENNSLFESPIITDGYLYATDRENVTLEITGVVNSMNQTDEQIVVLTKNPDNANYGSWNLVGNPQVYEVYPIVVHLEGEQYVDDGAKPYYRMNDGQELILGEGAIHPLEGVFMQSEYDGQNVRFSATPYEAPDLATTQGGITLNLTKEQNKVIDRAMVRFGEGSLMGKLMLNPNNTHICIPQSGKEYAVVRGEGEGELPVNFKAAENGIYTLTAEVNDADMDYLRLIDNLTGANVDLLRQPSYSFEAATTDYASRFKLVFSAGDSNNASSSSIFAYFNGSNWTVNNTGEATLQVIDVLGRVVSTETINGDAEINLSQSEGVYMLRLVNSDSVKVQKVVVR